MTTLDARPDATLSVVVMTGDEVAASALSALLDDAGVIHTDLRDAPSGAVAVVLEPDDATWELVARAGLRAVLITDAETDDHAVVDAVHRGAYGILGSDCSTDELISAVRSVASHGSALSPTHARAVVDALRRRTRPETPVAITGRERQILDAIADGESVKQTARRLGVSPRTIDNTQRVLFLKLGVRNRAHAVSRAHELGLLNSESS